MAKKETKKPQDTTVTEVAEEVVETPVEEEVEEVVEPVAKPEVVEESPVVAPVEGVDKDSVTEEEYLMVGYEDYTGKFTPSSVVTLPAIPSGTISSISLPSTSGVNLPV